MQNMVGILISADLLREKLDALDEATKPFPVDPCAPKPCQAQCEPEKAECQSDPDATDPIRTLLRTILDAQVALGNVVLAPDLVRNVQGRNALMHIRDRLTIALHEHRPGRA